MALLAWESNVIDPGHALRISEIAYGIVYLALQRFNRREARDVERDDHLARIRRSRIVFVEVDHVASKRGAVQRAGKQTEYKRQARSFVAADRKQKAFLGAPRVSQGVTMRVDHPTFRHHLASLSFGFHLAVRRDTGSNI